MSSRMISFTLWTEYVNAYAEDDQIYESDKDPLTLELQCHLLKMV